MKSRSQSRWKLPSRWPVWLGVVCIVLLLFSATVQVAHAHADGRLHADCVLCHVAQKTLQSSTPQITPQILHPVATVPVAAESGPRQRVVFFHLANRPPPVDPVIVA